MRVKSIKALAALVQEAESKSLSLQIMRLGHRTFKVEYGQEDNAINNQISPKKRRVDDFVYDTGFVSAGESAAPRVIRLGKTLIICILLTLIVFAGAAAFYVQARSGSVGAPTSFKSSSRTKSIWNLHTGAPGATTTNSGAKCVSNSLDYITGVSDWDSFTQAPSASWQVLSKVSLGGVQQLLLRPECWASKSGSIVVDLIKQNGHWELKSAAPLGPHS